MSLPRIPERLAITGRIESWLNDPTSRLPVSCTVVAPEDSMEGPNGIEDSWLFTSKALRNAAGVAVHLSKLRAKGTTNKHGLVSSGPVSFAQLYSKLNEVLRRGGAYKNGAVTLHLDYDHPDSLEFIQADRASLPWAKRALNVDEKFMDYPHMDAVIAAMKRGDLWLVKKSYDKSNNRILHNVCLEVLLPERGTCLLAHVNLGQCNASNLVAAFTEGMKFLCELHSQTGVGESGIYLSPEQDKQVGLGVIGLANMLANEGIKYAEFVEALEAVLDGTTINNKAFELATAFKEAYQWSSKVAEQYGMVRAFAIAPTASCSYRYKDINGFTTTPEIAPPISRQVDRDSATFGVSSYDYPTNVEIAEEVGWDVFFRLNCCFQRLQNIAGLGHAISTNWWSDMVVCDEVFIERWLKSPLRSFYYSLQVMEGIQDKSQLLGDGEVDLSVLGLGDNFFPSVDEEMPSIGDLNIPCVGCAE